MNHSHLVEADRFQRNFLKNKIFNSSLSPRVHIAESIRFIRIPYNNITQLLFGLGALLAVNSPAETCLLADCTFNDKRDDARFVGVRFGHSDAEVFALVVRCDIPQQERCVALQDLVSVQACSSFVLIGGGVMADHEAGVAVACAAHHSLFLVPHDPRPFAVGFELTWENAFLRLQAGDSELWEN